MVRYCGGEFSDAALGLLHQLLRDRDTYPTRVALLWRALCEVWDWRRPNGQFKDMSARQALLRMQADGLIVLPEPQRRGGGSSIVNATGAAGKSHLSLSAIPRETDGSTRVITEYVHT